MLRTVGVFICVSLASLAMSNLWPSEAYSIAMIAADALACAAITLHPAGKWQSIIGLSYILQIGVHIGRIANGENADITSFFWGLTALAILQLVLLGGWLTYEFLGHHFRGGADTLPDAGRHKSMAQ